MKNSLKASKFTFESEALRSELDHEEEQQQRIALESKRNEEVTAAKQKIEAKLGDLTEGLEASKRKRSFASLFGDTEVEAEAGNLPQTGEAFPPNSVVL